VPRLAPDSGALLRQCEAHEAQSGNNTIHTCGRFISEPSIHTCSVSGAHSNSVRRPRTSRSKARLRSFWRTRKAGLSGSPCRRAKMLWSGCRTWWRLVTAQLKRQPVDRVHRRYFELCVSRADYVGLEIGRRRSRRAAGRRRLSRATNQQGPRPRSLPPHTRNRRASSPIPKSSFGSGSSGSAKSLRRRTGLSLKNDSSASRTVSRSRQVDAEEDACPAWRGLESIIARRCRRPRS